MQLEKARKLREMWGKRFCDHPDIEKEYFLGSDTGDYVCVQCGRAFLDRDDWNEAREKNQQTKKDSD